MKKNKFATDNISKFKKFQAIICRIAKP